MRLFAALILVVWLGLDFQGLFSSVLGTYFYFGWTGTEFHAAKIAAIALLTVSGPLFYGLVLLRRQVRGELALVLGLQLAAYLFCAYVRQSDVFAWATVVGRLASGVAFVAVVRRMHTITMPAVGILLGVLLYLEARIASDGLMVAIHPTWPWVGLLAVLYAFTLSADRPEPVPSKPSRQLQLSAAGFVILFNLGLALVFNVNLWSAKTPDVHASVYMISFGAGVIAGLLAAPRGMLVIAVAMYVLLHRPYGIALGLAAHACGCYGLTVVCRRFVGSLDGAVPIAGLQVGAVIALLVFGAFLQIPNPLILWVAFVIGAALLWRFEPAPRARLAWLAPFVVAMLYQPRPAEQANRPGPELTVLTTNARYGWTDDFRFDPDPYVEWLRKHPATIIGMQEVNKGNFYGGFTDVFEYYRTRIPGRKLYGDANFGFGNALFTDLEVREWNVTPYGTVGMIRRSYIHAVVSYEGREIEVFVTHLSHGKHPNEVRQAQVEELVERLERTTRPWILMGDMNAHPEDPEIEMYKQVAHPMFRERGDPLLTKKTYPSNNPTERLDYIFFSKHFDLKSQSILDTEGTTDHRSIRSVLRLVR